MRAKAKEEIRSETGFGGESAVRAVCNSEAGEADRIGRES